ncbi:GyrI-like domain-containing protein [Dolosigranulum savutiense]|uniref:GyrI-like domain-containing protein n=1 Tax=Dolosigranulum savutiense TaxID=3110288 RepID=A0AB74U3H8_9LACT
MKYRIVKKRPFNIVGFKKQVPVVTEGTNPEIEAMRELLTDDVMQELSNLADTEPFGIISVSTATTANDLDEQMIDHYLGVAVSSNHTKDYDVLPIERTDWAVFEAIGQLPESLEHLWHEIFTEWLPNANYIINESVPLLWNAEDYSIDKATPVCEVWLPVIPK